MKEGTGTQKKSEGGLFDDGVTLESVHQARAEQVWKDRKKLSFGLCRSGQLYEFSGRALSGRVRTLEKMIWTSFRTSVPEHYAPKCCPVLSSFWFCSGRSHVRSLDIEVTPGQDNFQAARPKCNDELQAEDCKA